MSNARRNQICTAAPHPELKEDLPSSLLTSVRNLLSMQPHMPLWLRRSRLNPTHHDPPHRYLLGAGKLALMQGRAVASMNSQLPQRSP